MSDTKTICKDLIKDYCANCSFAGIHYIADDAKHWIERLLWVALVILSWYGSALLIIAAVEAFVQSPISFGVETVYIDWDTRMPSVGICELSNTDKMYKVADEIWTVDHLVDLEEVLIELAYYRGVSRQLRDKCHLKANPDVNCPMSNYSYYANLVRSDCDKILTNCSYNDNSFPCCDYFLPLETDIGTCFSINSVQTKKQNPYPMVLNLKNQRGSLKFYVTLPSMMYTLGDDEVPTVTTSLSSTTKLQLGNSYRRSLSVRDIENDPLLWETNTKQRACRFQHENEDGLYPEYSYSACTVLCRKRAQMQYCKCYDHFMLNTTEAERCNISGMTCLNNLSPVLTTLKPAWADRDGLPCDCLPSCDETEITVVSDVSAPLKGKGSKRKALVEMVLAYLPSERFKRNVVRSRQDLVVSVGGTTGLFVGASILSFVELFFFFTVRLCNNLWMNKKKRMNNNVMIVKSKKQSVAKHLEEMEVDLKNFRKYLP